MRIAVTGAAGNLGTKLVDHLIAADWCDAVIGFDNREVESRGPGHTPIMVDLTDPDDPRWRDALKGTDALVHFATRNPHPDCSWEEGAESIAMTSSLLDGALAAGTGRFVFASSNHTMGGYKDAPLAGTIGPGELTVDLPASPGTKVTRDGVSTRPVAYGASKLYGEAISTIKAKGSGGRLTAVSVRIGWCQAGVNNPATINALAVTISPEEAEKANKANPNDLAWFLGMWLSNRDFCAVMERAIRADAASWPAPGIVVNGMSANTGALWDLERGRKLIGYEPVDDWKRELG